MIGSQFILLNKQLQRIAAYYQRNHIADDDYGANLHLIQHCVTDYLRQLLQHLRHDIDTLTQWFPNHGLRLTCRPPAMWFWATGAGLRQGSANCN